MAILGITLLVAVLDTSPAMLHYPSYIGGSHPNKKDASDLQRTPVNSEMFFVFCWKSPYTR